MLEVKIENIIPATEAKDKFNQLVDSVEGSDDMFVMTKDGKPSAILVGVHHLEKLTGENHEELFGINNKTEEKEVELDTNTTTPQTPADQNTAAPADSVTPAVAPVSDTQSAMSDDIAATATPAVTPAVDTAPAEPAADAAPADENAKMFDFPFGDDDKDKADDAVDAPAPVTPAPTTPSADPVQPPATPTTDPLNPPATPADPNAATPPTTP